MTKQKRHTRKSKKGKKFSAGTKNSSRVKRFFDSYNVRVGDRIRLTEDAVEKYGKQYANKSFIVTNVAFNESQHPGYDKGVGGPLIDARGLEFSLYVFEFEVVGRG